MEASQGKPYRSNVSTGVREVHEFPVTDIVLTGCWMGDDRTMLLYIKKDFKAPTANYEIYRYNLVSRPIDQPDEPARRRLLPPLD